MAKTRNQKAYHSDWKNANSEFNRLKAMVRANPTDTELSEGLSLLSKQVDKVYQVLRKEANTVPQLVVYWTDPDLTILKMAFPGMASSILKSEAITYIENIAYMKRYFDILEI